MNNLTGSGFKQIMEVCKRNQDILTVVKRDNRSLRMTQDILNVRVSQWIPLDSLTGMRKFSW